ncbi:hypothetical protein HN51_002175 [Arachis hypogaea]|uniref:CASP-like protein n=1 Tax=Arachis hypogaea TaxID=3818 RepID=A0A445ENG7_ARAHY|nr:CASP-like protein 2C1 [Arachis hypogaea]QHO50341.1 CASP-like protein [Arachis hypogaea]RYR77007.1 hypothetical protein Ahy_A01g001497 [Arachis hypogaea]
MYSTHACIFTRFIQFMTMELRMARGETSLRISAIVMLVLTACLVAFDTQTKVIMLSIEKKATYKDMKALRMLVYVTSAAAGYNVLRLCKHTTTVSCSEKINKGSNIYMAWILFLLDQMAVYVTFGTNCATLEGSMLALTGSEALQWLKVCNRFTRFCDQIGAAVLCGYAASILMALISTVSAYKVMRMYSPQRFLSLKIR